MKILTRVCLIIGVLVGIAYFIQGLIANPTSNIITLIFGHLLFAFMVGAIVCVVLYWIGKIVMKVLREA